MSDVKGRAREALNSLGERANEHWDVSEWEDFSGREKTYYVEEAEEWRGHRNNIHFGSDRVLAEFFAASPHVISDLLSLVEEQEKQIERVRELADEWDSQAGPNSEAQRVFGAFGDQVVTVKFAVKEIRDALDCLGGSK